MKRKDIRKILKKWIDRETTEYNYLWHIFVDIGVGGTKMSREFESLVDEVDNMIQEEKNEEKDRKYKG